MDYLFDAMASLLALFYSFIPSYGASIVLLTLVVMIVLTPLTLKGTRSMMMMQQLQPEMKKIQNQYKDDRQKLNEELLKFYKENNINPMGGCLPLLAQMPVFLVLYTVLRGLTRRQNDMGFDVGWATGLAGSGSPPTKAPNLMLDFDPAYIEPTTSLYQSLSQVNVMEGPLGLDFSESASQALSQSIVHALPYFVLIAIVAVSGFVQQRQIQGRLTSSQINPQQQMLMKITPIMLPVFSFGLPGGLVLYFAVSNLYRIGQQWFISRSIYGIKRGEKPAGGAGGKGSPGTKGGPGGKGGSGGKGGKGGAVDVKVTAESTAEVDGSTKGDNGSSAKKSKATPSRAQANKAKQSQRSASRTTSRSSSKGSSATRTGKDTTPEGPVLQPRARKKKR